MTRRFFLSLLSIFGVAATVGIAPAMPLRSEKRRARFARELVVGELFTYASHRHMKIADGHYTRINDPILRGDATVCRLDRCKGETSWMGPECPVNS
jgi:hypothetical protein